MCLSNCPGGFQRIWPKEHSERWQSYAEWSQSMKRGTECRKFLFILLGLKGLGTCGLRIRLEAHLDEITASSSPGVPVMENMKYYLDGSINPSAYVFDGGKRRSTGYNPHEHVETRCTNEQNSRGSDMGPFLLCEAAELAAEPRYERRERRIKKGFGGWGLWEDDRNGKEMG